MHSACHSCTLACCTFATPLSRCRRCRRHCCRRCVCCETTRVSDVAAPHLIPLQVLHTNSTALHAPCSCTNAAHTPAAAAATVQADVRLSSNMFRSLCHARPQHHSTLTAAAQAQAAQAARQDHHPCTGATTAMLSWHQQHHRQQEDCGHQTRVSDWGWVVTDTAVNSVTHCMHAL